MTENPADPLSSPPAPFRVAFVPGVTPGKWSRTWAQRVRGVPIDLRPTAERDQIAVLHDDLAEMSFVRLPVDREAISLIPLYRETPVVVVSKDHPVEAFDEVSVADLSDEHLLQDPDDVPEWRDTSVEVQDGTRLDVPPMTTMQAIETVAAGVGIMIVPRSVARLYDRKDLVHRPVTGVPEFQVGLAWLTGATDPRIEIFIGIVRGRTERSSRDVDPAASTGGPTAGNAPLKKAAPRSGQKRQPQRSVGRRRTRRDGRR